MKVNCIDRYELLAAVEVTERPTGSVFGGI